MADSVHEDLKHKHEAAFGEMFPNLYNTSPVSPQGPQTPQVTNDPAKDLGPLVEQLYETHKRSPNDQDAFNKQLQELIDAHQESLR